MLPIESIQSLNPVLPVTDSQFWDKLSLVNTNTRIQELADFIQKTPYIPLEKKLSDWKITIHKSETLSHDLVERITSYARKHQDICLAVEISDVRNINGTELQDFQEIHYSPLRIAILGIVNALPEDMKNLDNLKYIIKCFKEEHPSIDRILKAIANPWFENPKKAFADELYQIHMRKRFAIPRDPEINNFDYCQKAAQFGSIDAMCNLANSYQHGYYDLKESEADCLKWYQKAYVSLFDSDPYTKGIKERIFEYASGLAFVSVNAKIFKGWMLEEGYGTSIDLEKAFTCFQEAAEQNSKAGMHSLAYAYHFGQGITKSPEKTIYWYEKAAQGGYENSMFNLGIIYSNGALVEEDLSKAHSWFLQAAELDHIDSMLELARMYENGRGVEKDLNKSIYWYVKAAKKNNMTAIKNLIRIFKNEKADAQSEVIWMAKGASLGDTQLMYNLSGKYYHGEGVTKNIQKAREWLEKGATAGHATCMCELGITIYNFDRDYKKAAEWFEKAADAGSSAGFYYLGLLHENGQGFEKDPKKALSLIEKAADGGFEPAMIHLGISSLLDRTTRIKWLEKAAKNDNETAIFELAYLYWKNEETHQQAIDWVIKGAKAGHEDFKAIHDAAHYQTPRLIYFLKLYFDKTLNANQIVKIFSTAIHPDKEEEQFFERLILWIKESPEEFENRISAMKIMVTCYKTKSEHLSLGGFGLTSIPEAIGELKNLKSLDVYQNKLMSLPDSITKLKCLEEIHASNNQIRSLPEEIGELTQLQKLSLDFNCLTTLPHSFAKLANLKYLSFGSNEFSSLPYAILAMPHLLDRISTIFYINSFWTSTEIKMSLKLSDLKENPFKFLHYFAALIADHKTTLKVEFLGEKGIDHGGLSRQFVSELFAALTKTKYFVFDDDFYLPMSKNEGGSLSAADVKIYRDIGKVLMFCYSSNKYPIGNFFKEEMFATLLRFDMQDLEKPFCQIPDGKLMHIQQNKDLSDMWDDADSRIYGSKAIALFDVFDLDPYSSNDVVSSLFFSKRFKDKLLEMVLPKLSPLHAMAQGMHATNFEMPRVSDITFAPKIQGIMSRDILLKSLNFDTRIDQEKQNWLKEWIANASKEELGLFVKAATGSPALPASISSIRIEQVGMNILFRSCIKKIEIAFDVFENKQHFFKDLSKTIRDIEYSFNIC